MNQLGPEPSDRELDEELRLLFERTGPRPPVPTEHLAAVKDAFRQDWQRHLTARRRTVTARRWLLAATLVAAVGAAWWWRRTPLPDASVVAAEVEASSGQAIGGPETGPAQTRLTVGRELLRGERVETGPGTADRVAIRLRSGFGVRLDSETRVRLDSLSSLSLERGALYVDSWGADPGTSLAIATPLGIARDIGTQFEVRLLGATADLLRVRVREGEVEVRSPSGTGSAGAGFELTLGADGTVHRQAAPGHGPDWQWVVEAAPPFEIEGRTLAEFLEWFHRETGLRVELADPQLAEDAASIQLHGSIGSLTAEQAPEVVLPGAALAYRIDEGVLHVSRPAR